ncbi:MAG TPA: LssY C-terminal domain-containing protein [Terriglobales bacterium]|nr:LssY C-terminal domain-containing protein [Terriglobales bacterium]
MFTRLGERSGLLAKARLAPPYVFGGSTRRRLLFAFLVLLWAPSWGEVGLIVPAGTPVRLRLLRTISSAHAQSGDPLEFMVLGDVSVSGFTVIRAGARAWGSVTAVHGRRPLGLPGVLQVSADSVEMVTGKRAALRAPVQFKGHPHFLRMTAEALAAAIIFLPAAPAALLTPGSNSVALKNTEITAHLDADVSLAAAQLPAASDPSLDELLGFFQPRVFDAHGREGDIVNLLFVAQQPDLERAFARAGWTSVDHSKHLVAWHLFCQGTHYTGLPMAHFFVFGRAQDYSYAMPDPSSILSKRHHVRIWKTDFRDHGTPVWLAAATHDVAIGMQKLSVTHHIDPQVDAERDFIGDNLTSTHLVAHSAYLSSTQPVFKATTTNGQPYYSDSRILLLQLGRPRTTAATLAVVSGERPAPEADSTRVMPAPPAVPGQSPGTP